MNTKQKIQDKALETFNERGIEYVGLRELAGLLDMRVSNITYYFPTKDDLVFHIAQELRQSNSEIMVMNERITMAGFLTMLHQVFHNHIRFRCLMLSFVHVITQNKQVAASYKKTQDVRASTLASNVNVLESTGYLKLEDKSVTDFLVGNLSLINRFWISEAVISMKNMSKEVQVAHYMGLITNLLWPYATAKGRKEIGEFRNRL